MMASSWRHGAHTVRRKHPRPARRRRGGRRRGRPRAREASRRPARFGDPSRPPGRPGRGRRGDHRRARSGLGRAPDPGTRTRVRRDRPARRPVDGRVERGGGAGCGERPPAVGGGRRRDRPRQPPDAGAPEGSRRAGRRRRGPVRERVARPGGRRTGGPEGRDASPRAARVVRRRALPGVGSLFRSRGDTTWRPSTPPTPSPSASSSRSATSGSTPRSAPTPRSRCDRATRGGRPTWLPPSRRRSASPTAICPSGARRAAGVYGSRGEAAAPSTSRSGCPPGPTCVPTPAWPRSAPPAASARPGPRPGLGAVSLDEVGPMDIKTGAGDVSVDRAVGRATIVSGSGAVRIGAVDGPAVVKNGNGETRIGELTGESRIERGQRLDLDRACARRRRGQDGQREGPHRRRRARRRRRTERRRRSRGSVPRRRGRLARSGYEVRCGGERAGRLVQSGSER